MDVLVEFHWLHWQDLRRPLSLLPMDGCDELGWELRDIWGFAQEQLTGVDTSELVVRGFTVIGVFLHREVDSLYFFFGQ